jgi:hypothetical protein
MPKMDIALPVFEYPGATLTAKLMSSSPHALEARPKAISAAIPIAIFTAAA